MRFFCLALALAASGMPVFADTSFVASATSEPVPIDASIGGVYTLTGDRSITLNADYFDAEPSDGAQVVLLKVSRPDTSHAVTSEVKRCSSAAVDGFLLQAGQNEGCYIRLLKELRSSSGKLIGTRLQADIACASAQAVSQEVAVDTKSDSFQAAAEKGKVLSLAYDTAWCTNALPASVEITCRQDRYCKGKLHTSMTNGLFSAASPCSGTFNFPFNSNGGGTFVFDCVFRDSAGVAVGDPLRAMCRFEELWGLKIILK